MRTLNRLTAIQVTRTKKPGVYSDGGGLYLQISRTLAKSWLFRYMRQGKARGMGLGPIHTVSLVEARIKALDCRRQLVNGIDPLDAKLAKRRAEKRETGEVTALPRLCQPIHRNPSPIMEERQACCPVGEHAYDLRVSRIR